MRFAHSSRKLSTSSGKSHEPSRRNAMRRSNMLIFVTTDKKLTLQGFNFPLTFCYSDNANYQSRLVLRVRSMSFLLHRALYFYSLLTMSHCLYCSEPPPQGWSVGPDRYYRASGLNGGTDWDYAEQHCLTYKPYKAQLAVPHSFDDAHFMKAHVMENQGFWVGKVFETP